MKYIFKLVISFSIFLSTNAKADIILLGAYSGKLGYFAKVGNEYQLTLDAIVMNDEVAQKVNKLKFEKLGETKTCDVKGMHQTMGYTIFKIITCK